MSKERRDVLKKGYQGGTLSKVGLERKPNVSDPRGGATEGGVSDQRTRPGSNLGTSQPPVFPTSLRP